jgi:hypothetical protein
MKKLLVLFSTIAFATIMSCGKSEKKTTPKVKAIEIVNLSQENLGRMSVTTVEVKNNTDKLLTIGNIKVIYKDKINKIVGTGLGTIVNLPAGKTNVVTCVGKDINGARKYDVQIKVLHYE